MVTPTTAMMRLTVYSTPVYMHVGVHINVRTCANVNVCKEAKYLIVLAYTRDRRAFKQCRVVCVCVCVFLYSCPHKDRSTQLCVCVPDLGSLQGHILD